MKHIETERFEDDHCRHQNEKSYMNKTEGVQSEAEVEHRGWIRTMSPRVNTCNTDMCRPPAAPTSCRQSGTAASTVVFFYRLQGTRPN